jgi:hypothetical protein
MTAHEEGIIREAANAAQMARLHGCSINVEISRWGHTTSVMVTPNILMKGGVQQQVTIDDQPTEVIELDAGEQQQDKGSVDSGVD